MTYALGVDIGTTFTAAATIRGSHAQIVPLGDKADTIPSVVLLREDETVLTGDAALRRGVTEPHRLAREFKRRFGQPEPILLGGTPYSPEALTAMLLSAVVDTVTTREGEPPSRICLSHPANWGPFKCDLLRQVVSLSGVTAPVGFTTEPEAAAIFYAAEQRVDPGSVVAVYDLGGGTFDAAVLRKTSSGFEILGQPEGIEQLGGIDVDAAVFHHVTGALGDRIADLDEDDPDAVAAVARLKRECVDAKEALSADTDVSVPVLLPGLSTDVRLTRGELESMVRPMLGGTVHALRRALESAQVEPADVGSVLLVGGGSRMPIVAQLIGAELGRPVAVDAHPKHAVALGAARVAEAEAAPDTVPGEAAPAVPLAAAGVLAAGAAAAGPAEEAPDDATLMMDLSQVREAAPPPPAPPPPTPPIPPGPPVDTGGGTGRRGWLLPLVGLVVAAVIAGGWLVADQLGWWSGAEEEPEIELTAAEQLDALVDEDRPEVDGELVDLWAPQLAVRKPGNTDEDTGITYDHELILEEHERIAADHDVVLVWTDDYPNTFALSGSYATLATPTFPAATGALAWCDQEGFVLDACHAKRVARTGDPSTNSEHRSVAPPPQDTPVAPTSAPPTEAPTETPTVEETTETPTDEVTTETPTAIGTEAVATASP